MVTHGSAISLGGSGLNLAAFPHLSQNPLSWAWLHLRDLKEIRKRNILEQKLRICCNVGKHLQLLACRIEHPILTIISYNICPEILIP